MIDFNELSKRFDEHNQTFNKMYDDIELQYSLIHIIDLLITTFKRDNKVLIAGNGGSAADAQHIAGELVGRFKKERKALFAEALSTDTSCLTSIGNDYSFDKVFSRQIEAKGRLSDVLIALTTSGNSRNIIEACKQAVKQGMIIVSITGNAENMEVEKYADFLIKIPSQDTARIQEMTVFIYHLICEYVEKEFE